MRELQPYVGKVIEAKIIELDRNRNNVVLSRRAWLEEAQKEQRGDFLQNLKPGERRKGVVSSVVNFGAFVDLGGMDGLVHVSELSRGSTSTTPRRWCRWATRSRSRCSTSTSTRSASACRSRPPSPTPGRSSPTRHAVGQLVYGRITKLVPFGAFVQVGDGIEGLVHISEMAVHHVDLPEQVVTPGEELWVKIIDIDLQRRRISLSIKQAAEGGEVSEEYREAFGEHAYDEEGNYIGFDYAEGEFTPETEAQAAWADFAEEAGTHVVPPTDRGEELPPGEPPPPRLRPEEAARPRLPKSPWLTRSPRPLGRRGGSEPTEAEARHGSRDVADSRVGRYAARSGRAPADQARRPLGVVREEQHRVEQLELEQRRPVRPSPPVSTRA